MESVLSYVFDRLFLYQLVSSLATYTILNTILFIRTRKRRHQLLFEYGIPGPKPRLLDGSLVEYTSTKTTFLVDADRQKKYGKIFSFYIGDEPNIIVTDLEILRKIFFEKQSSFKERAHVFMDNPLTKSLLLARYHRWKPMRKIISPAFRTFTMRGQASTEFIEDTLKLMLNYIKCKFEDQEKRLESAKNGELRVRLDIHGLMKATALKLITGLAINLPDVQVAEKESYVESLDSFLSQLDSGAVIFAIRFPFFTKIFEFIAARVEHGKTMSSIRRVLNKKIDETIKNLANSKLSVRSTEPEKGSQLIDTLIKNHYEGKLSREEVIGNCEALLFAGYDTTSTTLVYIFWVLGKHPKIQDKLRAELMAHGTESEYLEQVIKETMRLYPTVLNFVTRMATENVTVDNLTVPKGTRVIFHAWLMHRDPTLWPEPEKFDPERFRRGTQIHPCAYAPFGLSDRKCVGQSLAELELKMVTCDILCRYRIYLKSPSDLSLHTYATLLTKPSEKIILELGYI